MKEEVGKNSAYEGRQKSNADEDNWQDVDGQPSGLEEESSRDFCPPHREEVLSSSAVGRSIRRSETQRDKFKFTYCYVVNTTLTLIQLFPRHLHPWLNDPPFKRLRWLLLRCNVPINSCAQKSVPVRSCTCCKRKNYNREVSINWGSSGDRSPRGDRDLCRQTIAVFNETF